jgi:hypothetical protein
VETALRRRSATISLAHRSINVNYVAYAPFTVQQRISGVEMPHFIPYFLAFFVRDSPIALVRRAGQLAEIDLVFDLVEVDSDEIKIRGKISSHVHHDFEIRWF